MTETDSGEDKSGSTTVPAKSESATPARREEDDSCHDTHRRRKRNRHLAIAGVMLVITEVGMHYLLPAWPVATYLALGSLTLVFTWFGSARLNEHWEVRYAPVPIIWQSLKDWQIMRYVNVRIEGIGPRIVAAGMQEIRGRVEALPNSISSKLVSWRDAKRQVLHLQELLRKYEGAHVGSEYDDDKKRLRESKERLGELRDECAEDIRLLLTHLDHLEARLILAASSSEVRISIKQDLDELLDRVASQQEHLKEGAQEAAAATSPA